MEERSAGRGIEIATALALGIVSVVTALGALQTAVWAEEAQRYASDAADARDQSIALSVVAQLQQRSDLGATLEAARLVGLQEEAIAAGDGLGALALESDILSTLANAYALPEGSFEAWRAAGFPADANPAESSEYAVANRGEADALALTALRLDEQRAAQESRAAVFGQASLVHALALFLFGVAGLSRLRAARIAILAVGAGVVGVGLLLMASAY